MKEKQIRIREIQAAARSMFFKKGLKGTAMEDIAKKAGISKGSVYNYFRSKEDLYISLVTPVLEGIGVRLQSLERKLSESKYQTGKELLLGFLGVFWRIYQDDPDGLRIVQAYQQGEHFLEMSEDTSDRISYLARANFNVMRTIFTKAIELGMFKKVNVIQLSDALWAQYVGIVQLEESKKRSTGKSHIYDTLKFSLEMLIDGICIPPHGGDSPNTGK